MPVLAETPVGAAMVVWERTEDSQDEMNEMLEACVDRESGNLLYKNFLNQLVFEESI